MNQNTQSSLIYPFNTRTSFRRIGVAAIRGEGAYLVDESGNRLFDSISGMWNVPLGYSCEPIKRAIARQAEELPAASLIVATNLAAEQFASQLVRAMQVPSLTGVFLSSGGSEAIESAMKLSRHYFHADGRAAKRIILSMRGSYHGMTFGALAVTGIAEDRWRFGVPLPDVHQVSSPRVLLEHDGLERFIADIEAAIQYFGQANIAAIVIEPVFAVAGMIPVPREVLRRIRALCTEGDIHLIVDEVTTGIYRAGETFLACSAAEVEPDIAVMAKALTNGYLPLGATAINRRIADSVQAESMAFMHGHTFSGNPLACAAANACFQELQTKLEVAPASQDLTKCLRRSAQRYLDVNDTITAWRATGGLLGVDIAYPSDADARNISIASLEIRHECRRLGVIVRPTYGSRTFNFVPMYISTEAEIDNMLGVFSAVTRDVVKAAFA
jgi:adenosylmethionine-8-amino-7-oxononanoate aminotransferase